MPSAEEFDRAAIGFERAAEELDELLTRADHFFGPDTIRDGRLPMLIDLTIDTNRRSAVDAAERLRTRAATCRERAAVCREYESAMQRHWADMARWRASEADDDPPRLPRRPAPWVDAVRG